MKTIHLIPLSSVVLALAGCGNQGSSNDPYGTNSSAVARPTYDRGSMTNDSTRGALTQSPGDSGVMGGTNHTSLRATNHQGVATNSYRVSDEPLAPLRTNNVPVN
jgi:hypothetical protein